MINITNPKARDRYRIEVTRMMITLENINAKEIRPVLNRQYFDVASFVKQGMRDGIDVAVDRHRRRLEAVLKNHYKRVAVIFGDKAEAILAESKDIFIPEVKSAKDEYWKEMNGWMDTQAAKKISGLQKTAKNNIAKVIKVGVAKGESNTKIAKRIRKTGIITNPKRAMTIARTETHTAAVKSTDASMESTRLDLEKEWVSSRDNRTRSRIRGAKYEHFLDFPLGPNKERALLNGHFVMTGQALKLPGDPSGSPGNIINCRCVVLYHTRKSTDDYIKPYQGNKDFADGAPMSSIGGLQKCLTSAAKRKGVFIYDMRKARGGIDPCKDIVRKGGKFYYQGEEVVGEADLERIKKLAIPPSWKNVVIAKDPKKYVAIGQDAAERWQYKLNPGPEILRKRENFDRIKVFSKDMPKIRKGIRKGIEEADPRGFLLDIEQRTAIRNGSTTDYRAKVKAYGLTTLQHEHVIIKGERIIFDFPAKEGIQAHYEIQDKVLAKFLRERKKASKIGEQLFPDVSANQLNSYLSQIAGNKAYTVKDFRTYHGTRIAFQELKKYGLVKLNDKEKAKIIKNVSKKVSGFLRNTPKMALDSYIDPLTFDYIGGVPKRVVAKVKGPIKRVILDITDKFDISRNSLESSSYFVKVDDDIIYICRGTGFMRKSTGNMVQFDGKVVIGPKEWLGKDAYKIKEISDIVDEEYKLLVKEMKGGNFAKFKEVKGQDIITSNLHMYKSPLTEREGAEIISAHADAYLKRSKLTGVSFSSTVKRSEASYKELVKLAKKDKVYAKFLKNLSAYKNHKKNLFTYKFEDISSMSAAAIKNGQDAVNQFGSEVKRTLLDLKKRYPKKKIVLYRGVTGDYAKDIKKGIGKFGEVEVGVKPASSWTSEESIAKKFAGRNGVVIKKEFGIDEILFSHHTSPYIRTSDFVFGGKEEFEYIVGSKTGKISLLKKDIVGKIKKEKVRKVNLGFPDLDLKNRWWLKNVPKGVK